MKQLIIFEPTEIIQGLQSDVASQLPPFYDFQEIVLHNFKNNNTTQCPHWLIMYKELFRENNIHTSKGGTK